MPSAASSQSPSSVSPCSQIQRSACCAPQLWPITPGQPSATTVRPSTRSVPLKRAAGAGLSSFVRGSGVRYIQARGRWNSGGSGALKVRSHSAPSIAPCAWPGRSAASPTLIQSPPVAAGPGSVSLCARGPCAARSNSVTQSEPFGSAPGRLWTV